VETTKTYGLNGSSAALELAVTLGIAFAFAEDPDTSRYQCQAGHEQTDQGLPVLIAAGSRDQFCAGTAVAAAAIPGAQRLVVEGQTHHSTVSDPRFQATVLEFLGEG
jgi:pimeloyl-ACP methyl ester carboxylesterase